MPGTAGTLVAAAALFLVPPGWYPWAPWIGCLGASALCLRLGDRLAQDEHHSHDPGWFVLDEVAGMWLTATILRDPSWLEIGAAFLAFRIFDMTKPPPLRFLEAYPRGLGILLDDLGAAGYAVLVLSLLQFAHVL